MILLAATSTLLVTVLSTGLCGLDAGAEMREAVIASGAGQQGAILAEPGAESSESDAAKLAATIPNRLIVKLREGVNVCLSCSVAKGQRLGAAGVGSRLDELNRRYGVRRSWPLVRSRARGLAPETRAQAAAWLRRVSERFPGRALRKPPGAVAPDLSRTYVLEIRRRLDIDAVAREYAADPAVEYCEPDYVVKTALMPDDPFLGTAGSWGQSFDDLWGIKKIGAPAAWDMTRGAGVVVAIIDTGIDYTHPDISANVWINPGEIAGNGIDDDGNGLIDDVRGWDFYNDDADPLDDNGHGTHVAGTVAAVGNNAAGVAGVAYESQVMAVRGLGTYGSGLVSDLVAAILYAVDSGADVINASWGSSSFSQTLADTVATAYAAGVVFVAAAGNGGDKGGVLYPAADRNTIAVAAFTEQDERAYFSDYGIELDVAAPGGGDDPPPESWALYSILSLHSSAINSFVAFDPDLVIDQGGAEYLRLAGTSMAAPHVSGAAALVLAVNPTLSVEQVRQVLRSTAADINPPGPDDESGHGRIDAAAAVAAGPPLVAHISSPAGGKIVGAVSIDISGSAGGPGFTSYTLDYQPADDPSAPWTVIAGPVFSPVDSGLLASWNVAVVNDGDYVLRLGAERSGESFVDRVGLTLSNVEIEEPERLAAIRAVDFVEIRGTAAGAGFTSYLVEYSRPAIDPSLWRTDGIVQASPPGTPVRKGLLATLDVSGLTEGDRFDFRLTVENGGGTYVKPRSGIAIDPTLRDGWPQSIVPVGDAEYLTVSDLDGDGIQEILVGSGDEVVVFEPDGTVRPGWPQHVRTPDFPLVTTRGSPIVADVTGDAQPEVIATNRNEIFVWSADGVLAPGFPVSVEVFLRAVNDWITAADRDGDGKDEIICSGFFGVQVFRGDGTEISDSHRNVAYLLGPAAVADVDGDGRAEIVTFDEKFGFKFRGRGFRGYLRLVGPGTEIITERLSRAKFFPHPGMADFDGDGYLDMWVASESRWRERAKLEAMNRSGRRVRTRRQRTTSRRRLWEGSSQFSFADLDRDGQAEAYSFELGWDWDSQTFQLGYIVTHGYRRPAARTALTQWFFTTYPTYPAGMAIADVDGDGVQEFVLGISGIGCGASGCQRDGSEVFESWRGVVVQRPDGSFLPKFPKPLPESVWSDGDSDGGIIISIGIDDDRAATPAVADLDGDGLKEVVWVDPSTSRVFVWNVEGTPGALVADWPMYNHDAKHTNVFPVAP